MLIIPGVLASSLKAGGDFESIATYSLSSAQTTISFSSIPSTYKHLQLRVFYKLNVNDNLLAIRFNGDTASNYAFHLLFGLGSGTPSSSGTPNQNRIEALYNWANTTPGTTNVFMAGVIDILDYANTNKNKTVRTLGGIDYNGAGQIHLDSGLWASTSAINSISLNVNDYSSQFQQYSHFALYGIKG